MPDTEPKRAEPPTGLGRPDQQEAPIRCLSFRCYPGRSNSFSFSWGAN
jgi:hypothetical protein